MGEKKRYKKVGRKKMHCSEIALLRSTLGLSCPLIRLPPAGNLCHWPPRSPKQSDVSATENVVLIAATRPPRTTSLLRPGLAQSSTMGTTLRSSRHDPISDFQGPMSHKSTYGNLIRRPLHSQCKSSVPD